MEIKHTVRFATAQYCYIESVIEGTVEDAIQLHKDLQAEWNKDEKEGLNIREWRQFIVRYAKNGELDSADYEVLDKLSPLQRKIINDYKLTFNSIKNEEKQLETKYQTNK